MFPLRGRRQTAEWEIDLSTGELTARNKLASELGWREVGKKLPQPKPAKVTAPKRAATGRAEAGTADDLRSRSTERHRRSSRSRHRGGERLGRSPPTAFRSSRSTGRGP